MDIERPGVEHRVGRQNDARLARNDRGSETRGACRHHSAIGRQGPGVRREHLGQSRSGIRVDQQQPRHATAGENAVPVQCRPRFGGEVLNRFTLYGSANEWTVAATSAPPGGPLSSANLASQVSGAQHFPAMGRRYSFFVSEVIFPRAEDRFGGVSGSSTATLAAASPQPVSKAAERSLCCDQTLAISSRPEGCNDTRRSQRSPGTGSGLESKVHFSLPDQLTHACYRQLLGCGNRRHRHAATFFAQAEAAAGADLSQFVKCHGPER